MLNTIYSKDFREYELIKPEILRKKVKKIITSKAITFAESQETRRYFQRIYGIRLFISGSVEFKN